MNYTHYGNAGIPFALVKEYNSYAAMVADFKSGELCTDVRYGEYVIISNDDPENIDFIHNGAIYRRGYNYWDEETGGAVFISNISESQNKITQEAIEATKEAQSATKEMNDLYSEVKTSETDRVEKEAARVKAENVRNFAEQQRQSNENNRQQTIATWDEAIDDLPSYHKRMYNLEDNTLEKEVIASNSMMNEVPTEKMTYCSIEEIGGMSHKSENLLAMKVLDNKTINGVTFIKNVDGTYTANGTATEYIQVGLHSIKVDNTQKVWLSGGTIKLQLTVNAMLDSAFVQNVGTAQGTTVAITQNLTYDALVFYLVISKGQTFANETFYGMVNKGETALPYEPYFEGLRDSKVTEVQSVGVNLFDIEKRSNGSIDNNGDLKLSTGIYEFYKYQFKENTRYTISGYMKNDSRLGNLRLTFVYTDGTTNNYILTNNTTEWAYLTATSEEGKTLAYIGTYYGDSGEMFIKGGELMINEGTESKPYSPYFRHTFEIPKAVQNMDGYGQGINEEYYNKIILDPKNNIKKFVQKTKRVVFDGTEEWLPSPYGDLYFVVNDGLFAMNALDKIHLKCDRYSSVSINDRQQNNSVVYLGLYNQTTKIAAIFFRNIGISAVDEWKTYLAEQYAAGTPVTVEYVLATPIETDLSSYFTDDNMLKTEEGGTLTFVNEYNYDVPNKVAYYETTLLNNEDILNERGNRLDKTISQDLFTNTARDLDDKITQNSIDIEVNNKRLQNLEAALIGDSIEPVIDDTVAYVKDVPSNALPYASINEIGGMSYKCENLMSATAVYGNNIVEIDGKQCVRFSTSSDKKIAPIKFKENTQYSVMLNCKSERIPNQTESGTNEPIFTVWYTDGTKITPIRSTVGNGWKVNTWTSGAGKTIEYIGCEVYEYRNYNYIPLDEFTIVESATVPKNFLPYFTGLRDSKVTALESVGVNLFSGIDGVDFSKQVSVNKLSGKKINCDFKPNTRYRFSQTSTCISSSGTDHVLYLIVNYTDGTVDNWNNVIARITDNKTHRKITTAEGKTVSTMVFMYATEGKFLFEETSLTEYTGVDIPYSPYFKNTFPIPEAVQNMDGYGQGVNEQYCNKIVLDPAEGVKKFVGKAKKKTLNGSEAMSIQNVNTESEIQQFNISLGFNAKYGEVICNRLPTNVNALSAQFGVYATSPNFLIVSIYKDWLTDFGLVKDDTSTYVPAMSAFLKNEYDNGNPFIAVCPLATPTETDISAYFTDDNLIGVEAGGTITAVNEFEHNVPTTFEYLTKGATA